MVKDNHRNLKILLQWSTGFREILTMNTSLPLHCLIPESETLRLAIRNRFPDLPTDYKILGTSFITGVPDELHETLCELSLQLENPDVIGKVANSAIFDELIQIKSKLDQILNHEDSASCL